MTETPNQPPVPTADGFFTAKVEFVGEPGVGLTLYPDYPGSVWMSWQETVDLHAWLSEIVAKGNNNG